MPFVARNARTGERIDILGLSPDVNPKTLLKSQDLVCQICGSPMLIRTEHSRKNSKVHAHFVHKAECSGEYEGHPESRAHMIGKAYLRKYLTDVYREYAEPRVDLEVPIPMAWRSKGRIADLMVSWPMGWREVHEVQLAPITAETLEERTDDYLNSGCDVTWWIGGKADTDSNRNWLLNRFGECLLVEIEVFESQGN